MKWKSKRRQVIALSILMVLHVPSVLMDSWGLDQHQSIAQEKEKKVEEVEGLLARPLNGQCEQGLLGYYYTGDESDSITYMRESKSASLRPDIQVASDCIEHLYKQPNQKMLKHTRWEGYIQVQQAGEYSFGLTGNSPYSLLIGEENVGWREKKKALEWNKKVRLKANRWYEVCIQCNNIQKEEEITFWWKTPGQTEQQPVPREALILKNVKIKEKQKIDGTKNTSPYTQQQGIIPSLLDDDKDGLPNDWEKNGYFYYKGGLAKWFPEFASKPELKKMVSSPCLWSTTGDPYSDYEKAMGHTDGPVSEVARNPMVAAYPVVTASIEQVILSLINRKDDTQGGHKTETITHQTTTTKNKKSTRTYGSVGGTKKFVKNKDTMKGNGWTLDGNYKSSDNEAVFTIVENKNTNVKTENEQKEIFSNEGASASIGFVIRYKNKGTAPIYCAMPTCVIYVKSEDGQPSIIYGTEINKQQQANELYPDQMYPSGRAGILINSADWFNAAKITMSKEQLQLYLKNKEIYIDTIQCSGKVTFTDDTAMTEERDWDVFMGEIKSRTAKLVLHLPGESPIERSVAAKGMNSPLLKTIPEMTLGQALELVYGFEKTGDHTYTFNKNYVGEQTVDAKDVFKNGLHLQVDFKTLVQCKEQLDKMDHKNIYDLKIRPGMCIHLYSDEHFSTTGTDEYAL